MECAITDSFNVVGADDSDGAMAVEWPTRVVVNIVVEVFVPKAKDATQSFTGARSLCGKLRVGQIGVAEQPPLTA